MKHAAPVQVAGCLWSRQCPLLSQMLLVTAATRCGNASEASAGSASQCSYQQAWHTPSPKHAPHGLSSVCRLSHSVTRCGSIGSNSPSSRVPLRIVRSELAVSSQVFLVVNRSSVRIRPTSRCGSSLLGNTVASSLAVQVHRRVVIGWWRQCRFTIHSHHQTTCQ